MNNNTIINFIHSHIPWLGYAFLGFLAFALLKAVAESKVDWLNFLCDTSDDNPNGFRALILFTTLLLAGKFVITVISKEPAQAVAILDGLDSTAITGGIGYAFLLQKFSGGNKLFKYF